jgi:hypothetical protein
MKEIAMGIEEIAKYCQMPIKPVDAVNHLELTTKTATKKYRNDSHAAVSSGMRRSSK